jgi:hypothetical protein
MPTVLDNENRTLRFTFTDDWRIWPWDELPDYIQGIAKLPETKAVDFVGIFRDSRIYFIEVKDCRTAPAANQARVGDPLAVEVGQKTRDTIAGLAGAHRRAVDLRWQPLMTLLADRDVKIHVALWLEMIPTNATSGRRSRVQRTMPANATFMLSALKRRIAWLDARAHVVSLASNTLPGLVVQNLPGAGFPASTAAGGTP